jgi:hypothetical protein
MNQIVAVIIAVAADGDRDHERRLVDVYSRTLDLVYDKSREVRSVRKAA